MRVLAAVNASPRPKSMKFPVISLVTGKSGSRDGFAQDCPLQRGVRCEPDFRSASHGCSTAAGSVPGAARTGRPPTRPGPLLLPRDWSSPNPTVPYPDADVQVRDLRFKKYIAATTLLRRVSRFVHQRPSTWPCAACGRGDILLVHSRDQSVGGLRRCAAPHGPPMRERAQENAGCDAINNSHQHPAVSQTELVL